jgi:hypothetical protein
MGSGLILNLRGRMAKGYTLIMTMRRFALPVLSRRPASPHLNCRQPITNG